MNERLKSAIHPKFLKAYADGVWMMIMHFVSEEKFNLSANYCSHIEEHTNDQIYAEIEKEV